MPDTTPQSFSDPQMVEQCSIKCYVIVTYAVRQLYILGYFISKGFGVYLCKMKILTFTQQGH